MRYFEQFPTIVYEKYQVKDILANVTIDQVVQLSSESYYPYVLTDGQEPWMLAADYYGDPNLVWLVYMANKTEDPYHDWFMDTYHFEESIKKKYGTLAAAQAQVAYYQDPTTGIKYTADSYTHSTDPNKSSWVQVSVYDDAHDKNEARRNIKLLSRGYAPQAEANLKALLES